MRSTHAQNLVRTETLRGKDCLRLLVLRLLLLGMGCKVLALHSIAFHGWLGDGDKFVRDLMGETAGSQDMGGRLGGLLVIPIALSIPCLILDSGDTNTSDRAFTGGSTETTPVSSDLLLSRASSFN